SSQVMKLVYRIRAKEVMDRYHPGLTQVKVVKNGIWLLGTEITFVDATSFCTLSFVEFPSSNELKDREFNQLTAVVHDKIIRGMSVGPSLSVLSNGNACVVIPR